MIYYKKKLICFFQNIYITFTIQQQHKMATYKKCDYVEIIKDELAKQGKRLTNLSKLDIPQLKSLCIKYNFDIDALYPTHIQQKKQYQERLKIERKEKKERDEIQRREWEIKQKAREDNMKRVKQHYENLSQEIKDNCIKVMEEAFQKQYEKELYDYEKDYENRKNRFEKVKKNVLDGLIDEKITLEDVENNGGSFKCKNGIYFNCGEFNKPYRMRLDGDYSHIEIQKPVQNYLWSIKAYRYKKIKGSNKIQLIV